MGDFGASVQKLAVHLMGVQIASENAATDGHPSKSCSKKTQRPHGPWEISHASKLPLGAEERPSDRRVELGDVAGGQFNQRRADVFFKVSDTRRAGDRQ